jgi:hypothetical protein
MKRLVTILLVVLMFALSVRVVLAEGDKVRGEKGEGSIIQNCYSFENCPYGTYEP